ncbi:hypothetical protein VPHK354_0209 [Vibrio phage K354]
MERYEQRRWKLQTLDNSSKEDSKGLCVSYFCPENPDWETFPKEWVKDYKEGRPNKPVTGTVYVPKKFKQDIQYDSKKAFDLLMDRLYTKKLTKGRRITLRQSFLEEVQKSTYDWAGLMHYLRQAYAEDSKWVLLSRKEIAMLQPPKTQKQLREERLQRNLISY